MNSTLKIISICAGIISVASTVMLVCLNLEKEKAAKEARRASLKEKK